MEIDLSYDSCLSYLFGLYIIDNKIIGNYFLDTTRVSTINRSIIMIKHMKKTIKHIFSLLSLLMVFVAIMTANGCSKKEKRYRIGVDPSWYGVELDGKQPNVYAFSNELLKEIAKVKKVNFDRVNMAWDNIVQGLTEKKYEGILSSITPYPSNASTYFFSDIYLQTGPVLLLRTDIALKGEEGLIGKEIATSSQAYEALLIQKYPGAIPKFYDSISSAMNDILNDTIDGAIVPFIPALVYIQDQYEGKIKIASSPLNEEGLRLVAMQGSHKELIPIFNEGLQKLRENGVYERLLKKWDIE